MGRTSTKNNVQQEQITVTSSGRKIIKPTSVQDPKPIGAKNSNKKNNKLKDSDSESESDSSEEEQTQKSFINNKKTTTTVNRKEKATTAKTTNITPNVENSDDDEDDQDEIPLPVQPKKRGRKPKQPSSSSTDGSSVTKKYTQRELDVIAKQNRMVYIKFILFSIAMVAVPLMSFRLVNTTVGDYFGINRTDRVTYAGVASLLGLISVMASYSIMAYYED